MAGVSTFNPFICKTLSLSPKPQFNSKISLPTTNSLGTASIQFSKISIKSNRSSFRTQATDADDEWGTEKVEVYGETEAVGTATATAVAEPPKEPTEMDVLKKALIDSLYGTDRGLKASSETRAEIIEIITHLEAKNPTPAPTDALPLLNGKWILAYTSFVGLFPLLAQGTLPLVKVDEISQTIDSENFTVQNSVQFVGPLATTAFSTNAKFEVRSPQRVQIKFEEGIIGTPQLTDSIELPESVEFLGQKIDLSPFKGLITSLEDTASSVAKTISSQPPFKFRITSDNAQSWLLTTYLDEELRISRGDGGSVYVLIKEGSCLLTP